jgi:hypothetical protein
MARIEDEMSNAVKIDYENLFKRLLMLNQKGVYLNGADGHVWIEADEEADYPLQLKNVAVNNKIYGGVIQAIDVMDVALRMDGQPDLMDTWNEWGKDVLFLGRGEFDKSRIDMVDDERGGLY